MEKPGVNRVDVWLLFKSKYGGLWVCLRFANTTQLRTELHLLQVE